MKEYPVNSHNIQDFMVELQKELEEYPVIIVNTQQGGTGKWGMARLWRAWMASTAEFMANNGVTMPLMFDANGKPYGRREFNASDAHELFSHQFLMCDSKGVRLSWSRSGRCGMRSATKGERLHAMNMMNSWATERGINLFSPRGSEYEKLNSESIF